MPSSPSHPPSASGNKAHPLTTTLSHQHHALTGLDALNFPTNTESGPQTDEYTVETAQGWISPAEEVAEPHQNVLPSPTPTVVGSSEKPKPVGAPAALTMSQGEREKGLEIKLVTFTEGDKEDPRNWSKGTKW